MKLGISRRTVWFCILSLFFLTEPPRTVCSASATPEASMKRSMGGGEVVGKEKERSRVDLALHVGEDQTTELIEENAAASPDTRRTSTATRSQKPHQSSEVRYGRDTGGAVASGTLQKTEEKHSVWSDLWGKVASGERWVRKSLVKTTENAAEWVGELLSGDHCPFTDSPARNTRRLLEEKLCAQEMATESILSSIESWEFSLDKPGQRPPLVMAITGPTGIGKTETSNLIAEGIMKRRQRLANSNRLVPNGLLIFRGEDFSDNYTNPITQYHEQIKSRLVDHLTNCNGKAVVVFDEVQKVIPHTLDVLMEAVSERPQLTYYSHGKAKTVDCSNVIFILVSDIGADKMLRLLLAYGERELIPEEQLYTAVKESLDRQWERLQFGKMITKVVPFLPLEPKHIQSIVELKLRQLDEEYRGIYWKSLSVEPGLSQYLSRAKFIRYLNHTSSIQGSIRSKVLAKYGARNVENGGPMQRVKAKLFRYLPPWDTDAEVLITFDEDSSDVGIQYCWPKVESRKGNSENGSAHKAPSFETESGSGLVSSKQSQHGGLADSQSSHDSDAHTTCSETDSDVCYHSSDPKRTNTNIVGETEKKRFSSLRCVTKWRGPL